MSFARPLFENIRSAKPSIAPRFLGLPLIALAMLAGCSDPVPPAAQAAWSISFVDNGAECATKSHNTVIGDVTDSLRRVLVVDGVGGADIACTVSGTNSFRVSDTSALQQGRSLSLAIPSISKSAKETTPAPGSMLYSSEVTGGDGFQPPEGVPCNFYFVDGTQEGVAAGKIWVAFKCPEIIGDGGTQTCQISQGYAIFENCATQ
jgi:hypothetical protein